MSSVVVLVQKMQNNIHRYTIQLQALFQQTSTLEHGTEALKSMVFHTAVVTLI